MGSGYDIILSSSEPSSLHIIGPYSTNVGWLKLHEQFYYNIALLSSTGTGC